MSVSELKERHAVATETVNNLRDRLKQRRLQLLDTDVAKYSVAQGRSPVKFGATDLVCCRTLQGHTGKLVRIVMKEGLGSVSLSGFIRWTGRLRGTGLLVHLKMGG
ncbi:hypothetical protein Rs2_50778 [Raphanus sativus]|nr:hypothetical protein Rs2_50778 [Raphanus sativus]